MVRGSQSIGYSNKHRTYTDPKFDQVKRDNDRLRQQIEELTRNKDAKDRAELEQVSRNEALRRDLANPFTPSPPSGAAVPPAPVLPSGAPDYRLSVERIKAHCDSHNIILVTFVNSKRANYAYTWASHLMRLRLTNYMVGAMDGEALVKLAKRNITAFDMAAGLTTADYGWGTKNFRMLGLRKSELIITLLKAGADPIVTDADALITRDPTPYILRYGKGADILVTSDQCAPAPPPPHRRHRTATAAAATAAAATAAAATVPPPPHCRCRQRSRGAACAPRTRHARAARAARAAAHARACLTRCSPVACTGSRGSRTRGWRCPRAGCTPRGTSATSTSSTHRSRPCYTGSRSALTTPSYGTRCLSLSLTLTLRITLTLTLTITLTLTLTITLTPQP
jgi:hypothetical protein